MRGLLAIVIGAAFVAFALELFVFDDPAPLAIRIAVGLFGIAIVWAGFYHSRLRLRRRAAYRYGREKRGKVRLHRIPHEDDATAVVVFATYFSRWLLSVDASSLPEGFEDFDDERPAIGWFGEDDLIYALDIDGKPALPLSPGKEITREIQEKLDKRELLRAKLIEYSAR